MAIKGDISDSEADIPKAEGVGRDLLNGAKRDFDSPSLFHEKDVFSIVIDAIVLPLELKGESDAQTDERKKKDDKGENHELAIGS